MDFSKIEKCTTNANEFLCALRVASRNYDVFSIIRARLNVNTYVDAITTNENSESLIELVVQIIKRDESGEFGQSFMHSITCDKIIETVENSTFKIKANFVHAFQRITKNIDASFIRNECGETVRRVVQLSVIDTKTALKLMVFIIKEGLLNDVAYLDDIYREVIDMADEEEIRNYSELTKIIEEFFDDGD